MVQLDNLIELTNGIAPPKLYRYNRFVSATISAGLADGKTIGQGLDEMDKIAKETLTILSAQPSPVTQKNTAKVLPA